MARTVRRASISRIEHPATNSDLETRAEIIRAAARAFMTFGYAGSSIDMVAEELGCTKGRIYYYYKGKTELFFDVQHEAMRMNMAAVEPIATGDGPATERIRRMVEQQILVTMDQLPFQRVLVQGVEMHLEGRTTPAQREVLDQLIRQRDLYEQLFVRVLADGVRRREFRRINPGLYAKVLLGSMVWLTVWYRPQAREVFDVRQRLARELADYMLNGLTR